MNKEAKTYQLINDYLNGSLSEFEMAAFETRIVEDANFKTYFEAHQLANQLIIVNEEQALKNKLATIHKKSLQNKKLQKLGLILLIAIGISSVVYFTPKVVDTIIEVNSNEQILEIEESKKTGADSENNKVEKIPNAIAEVPTEKIEEEVLVTESSHVSTVDSVQTLVVSPPYDSLSPLESSQVEVLTKNESTIEDIEIPVVPACETYVADVLIRTTITCENKAEGALIIETDKNYSYSLNKGVTKQKESTFSNLRAGEYKLVAIDENSCKSEPILAKVNSVVCDFVIQPSQNIYWEINTSGFDESIIQLEIYSAKSGQKVYEKKLDLYEANSWSGEGLNGNDLPMGSYVYVLYSNVDRRSGSVTIVR